MAVTSIWRIKGAIGKVVLYVQNEDKTMSKETIESDKKLLEESELLDVVFDYVIMNQNARIKYKYIFNNVLKFITKEYCRFPSNRSFNEPQR